ncbi:MAG TPA: acyltransferase [Candidatus Hydrogenedentes bacterium]|nr:acyltransferase [Candidatus Hydrogenedentota bacterium]
MNPLLRTWRTWIHGRKFVSKGAHCRFPAKYLEVDGHVELGDDCRFRNNVILRTKGDGKIIFGTRSGCSYFCFLEATKLINIGDFTGLAEFSVVRDTNHLVLGTAAHWRLTPYIAEPIVIGNCVLITSRVYIGPGVAIGDGAVIAPNSVVTKDVGPLEVWGGNPARKLAHRTEGLVARMMQRKYGQLLEEFGLHRERYFEDMERASEQATDGINRAALERDQYKAEMADSKASQDIED